MANINQISPDGGTTVYDIEDTPARSSINSLTPRVGIVEGKVSTLEGQMLSVEDDLDALGTASTKNSTSVVTESSDLVESGAVKDIVGWGNKNKLKGLATASNKGVTVALQSNGAMLITGTMSGVTFVVLSILLDKPLDLPNGEYVFSVDTAIDDVRYEVYGYDSDFEKIGETAFGEAACNVTISKSYQYFRINLIITNNAVYDNKTIYPMISKDGGAYEPYHASVDESKCDNSVIGTVEGANASKAWSVGEHFISGGQFKEVTQAIASGGAINDSNTVDKPIADCLVKQEAFTITTNAGGLANLTDQNSRIILRIDSANSKICFPYRTTSGTNNIIVFNNDMTVAGNTEVSGTYCYI